MCQQNEGAGELSHMSHEMRVILGVRPVICQVPFT